MSERAKQLIEQVINEARWKAVTSYSDPALMGYDGIDELPVYYLSNDDGEYFYLPQSKQLHGSVPAIGSLNDYFYIDNVRNINFAAELVDTISHSASVPATLRSLRAHIL